ncbi:STAS domain-containing protein [Actinoallomurus sp. CA-142502]|uniref:STAS domain-containing protein n=1 Tax=Actinoallomurus sp. CA-142502 TaxID=3239885 RepID=UPI003D8F4168
MPSTTRSPLSVTTVSGATVGTFPAEADASNATAIRDQLLHLIGAGAGPLVLDLTATEFCDCACVGVILRAGREAAARRTRICLVLPPAGPVRRIAAMTGLDRRFPVEASVAGAVPR